MFQTIPNGGLVHLSGRDERKPLTGLEYCPVCEREILTWQIESSYPQPRFAIFNCTPRYGGPDYALDGPLVSIVSFICNKCHHIFEVGTARYQLLLRGMKRSPHIQDNINRSENVRATYERQR